jgi:4'-phosphopantetheinyl transferase
LRHLPDSASAFEISQSLEINRKEGPIRAKLTLVRHELVAFLVPHIKEILSPTEQKLYQSQVAQKRKNSYLLGRYSLKKAAAHFLHLDYDFPLHQLEMASAILEYPILKYASTDLPDLTLSHSDLFGGAIAFQAGHVMGMDIEYINPSRVKAFERVMTEAEIKNIKNFDAKRLEILTIYWTLKEALSKAVKCGFTVPFPILELIHLVHIGPGHYETHFVNFGQYKGSAWILGDHAFAIVYPRKSKLAWNPQHNEAFWQCDQN